MATLDELYGVATTPLLAVKDHEYAHRPQSIQFLDSGSASALSDYLLRLSALRALHVFPQVFPLLWVMDMRGHIWIAAEEVIDEDGRLIGVLPKAAAAKPPAFTKLGHPSMLAGDDRLARIAGEIEYDPIGADLSALPHGDFCLSNASGRYGTRADLNETHLDHVSSKFNDFGLYFRTFFVRR